MSKLKEKQITLDYLENNSIPYFVHKNTIISIPQSSPDFENLFCKYTKCVHNDDSNWSPVVLIHNY